MALPALIYAAGAALGGAVGSETIQYVKARVRAKLQDQSVEIIDASLKEAGLDLEGEGLTDASLTRAINTRFLSGSGFELTSVLDRERAREGIKNAAMKTVADSLGVPGGGSVAEMRAAVQEMIVSELQKQIQDQAGEVLDAAPSDPGRVKQIKGGAKSNWNQARDMTKAGINNRERQARWRGANTKYWTTR